MQLKPDAEEVLRLKGVSLRYGEVVALRDVSCTIRQGDFVGIIGPNGSGKTSFLKVALGLVASTSGQVWWFGQPLGNFQEWRRVGYLPQQATHFDPQFPATVEEVVAMGRLHRHRLFQPFSKRDREAVDSALELVGMLEHRRRLIGQLSGGQQQRAFIAKVLAGEPQAMLLDEPTSSVDAEAIGEFYTLLHRLNKELGMTILLVSHDIGAVTDQCSALCCINQRVFFHRDPRALLDSGQFSQVLADIYGEDSRFVLHRH